MASISKTKSGWRSLWSRLPEDKDKEQNTPTTNDNQNTEERNDSRDTTVDNQQENTNNDDTLRSVASGQRSGNDASYKTTTTGSWFPWTFRSRNENSKAGSPVSENRELEDLSQDNKNDVKNEENTDPVEESAPQKDVDRTPSGVNSNRGQEEEIGSQADNDNEAINERNAFNKKKSSWSFWNNDSNSGDKKERQKSVSLTNTLVQSTPSIPSRQDVTDGMMQSKQEYLKDTANSPPTDVKEGEDAVLYKAHTKPEDLNRINTHTNENLKENVIVPDWNNCLPQCHSSSMTSNSISNSIFGNHSTSNQDTGLNSKVDFKNLRNFLQQLSSRLGFGSQTLTSVVEQGGENQGTSDTANNIENEFNLLYEKTYRLYGKRLSRLPPHKCACIPNYDKFYSYSEESGVEPQAKRKKMENDESNSISVTNDPLGNLLINRTEANPPLNKKTDLPQIYPKKPNRLQKIKKILIIGVHGFFPTKMIRPIIGHPKGTSLKFANEAEKAIIRYCVENNLIHENSSDVSIQKIALEKEGKIFDRVQFFTEVLHNWTTEINDADFIFIASHSQGCVVSIMLLARLIDSGILKNAISKRIGILGMAGVNNGPFYGVDKSFLMKAYTAIEHESLAELFELTKFDSEQSVVYKKSMQTIVNANVKICFIGSINDQLVPLYSSLASHIFHPNIYRACYIDYSSQTPLFIQKLVSLCCHMVNLGYFDSNVLKELSILLAGPLTGGGHSKIYNDGKVYDLGVKFVLDTDDIVIPYQPSDSCSGNSHPRDGGTLNTSGLVSTDNTGYGLSDQLNSFEYSKYQLPISNKIYIKEYNVGKIGTNPFILPWCLRGLLFNIERNWPDNNKLLTVNHGKDIGKSGYDEISDFFKLFESWKPETKALKELKFRLNGIRASKL